MSEFPSAAQTANKKTRRAHKRQKINTPPAQTAKKMSTPPPTQQKQKHSTRPNISQKTTPPPPLAQRAKKTRPPCSNSNKKTRPPTQTAKKTSSRPKQRCLGGRVLFAENQVLLWRDGGTGVFIVLLFGRGRVFSSVWARPPPLPTQQKNMPSDQTAKNKHLKRPNNEKDQTTRK